MPPELLDTGSPKRTAVEWGTHEFKEIRLLIMTSPVVLLFFYCAENYPCAPRRSEAYNLTLIAGFLYKLPTSSIKSPHFMDDTDRELISLLRDDARMPVAVLAKKLRVARSTVQNRLARLEKEGTIQGYTLRLLPGADGQRIRALTTVAVEGNRTAEVLRALRGYPSVHSLHSTNGRWDIVVDLRVDTLEAFDKVLNAIRNIDGVANTETSLLLSTFKA